MNITKYEAFKNIIKNEVNNQNFDVRAVMFTVENGRQTAIVYSKHLKKYFVYRLNLLDRMEVVEKNSLKDLHKFLLENGIDNLDFLRSRHSNKEFISREKLMNYMLFEVNMMM